MSKNLFKGQYNSGMYEAVDDLQLFEQWWQPKDKPKAVVVIIHGYGEHSSRYTHVAEHLGSHGYAVDTFDLRGHGKSEGARTFIKSFDEYLDDVGQFLVRVRERHPEKTMFMLGHSMGGAITTLFIITKKPELSGVVLSGAAVKISDDISPLLVKISGVIGSILPKLPTIRLDASGISRDPEVVQRYDNDPLVYRGKIPARTGAELTRATKLIHAKMNTIELPLLIMHGTDDRLADPEGSKQLYEHVKSTDKTVKLYKGFYHEVLNEPEKEQVFADVVQWLDAHL